MERFVTNFLKFTIHSLLASFRENSISENYSQYLNNFNKLFLMIAGIVFGFFSP